MSRHAIRAALETAVAAMTPALATAWENTPFAPSTNVPYQAVWFIWAEPTNDEFGRSYREQGVIQVNLSYLPGVGAADAEARADMLRNTFFRGASFVAEGLTVSITRTPEISTATVVDGRYVVSVRIRFHAAIQN